MLTKKSRQRSIVSRRNEAVSSDLADAQAPRIVSPFLLEVVLTDTSSHEENDARLLLNTRPDLRQRILDMLTAQIGRAPTDEEILSHGTYLLILARAVQRHVDANATPPSWPQPSTQDDQPIPMTSRS